jgi:hypothetical protein
VMSFSWMRKSSGSCSGGEPFELRSPDAAEVLSKYSLRSAIWISRSETESGSGGRQGYMYQTSSRMAVQWVLSTYDVFSLSKLMRPKSFRSSGRLDIPGAPDAAAVPDAAEVLALLLGMVASGAAAAAVAEGGGGDTSTEAELSLAVRPMLFIRVSTSVSRWSMRVCMIADDGAAAAAVLWSSGLAARCCLVEAPTPTYVQVAARPRRVQVSQGDARSHFNLSRHRQLPGPVPPAIPRSETHTHHPPGERLGH